MGGNSVKTAVISLPKEKKKKNGFTKRKEFASCGSKVIPFRVDLFQKGLYVQENKQEATKIISIFKTSEKSSKRIQFPFSMKFQKPD